MNTVQSTGHTGSCGKKDSQIEVKIKLSSLEASTTLCFPIFFFFC